jgi:hypothetical protein
MSQPISSKNSWQLAMDMVPVEILLHLPYVTRVWDFFIAPWLPIEVEWDSMFDALLAMDYDIYVNLELLRLVCVLVHSFIHSSIQSPPHFSFVFGVRADSVMQILINHLVGPNMPLAELHLHQLRTSIRHGVEDEGYRFMGLLALDASYYNNQVCLQ